MAAKSPRRSWTFRFIRNALLLLVPVALVWTLLTPFYNRLLLGTAKNLVRLAESPDVTDLLPRDDHFAYISRRDFPPSRSLVHSFRVTDVHFPVVMLVALFLAVPDVPMRKRMESLGFALLITVFFQLFLILFYVKATYAAGLGAWSLSHYGAFARNFWGMGRHLLDLPIKLALPFLLWAGFYYEEFLRARSSARAQ
jgi:hypothetical protein